MPTLHFVLAAVLLAPTTIVHRSERPLPTWKVSRPSLVDDRTVILLDGKKVTPEEFFQSKATVQEIEIKGRRVLKIIAITEETR